jgi:hypothetical protein
VHRSGHDDQAADHSVPAHLGVLLVQQNASPDAGADTADFSNSLCPMAAKADASTRMAAG